jgi:hypothetical protein
VVIYRGSAYLQAGDGAPELVVATANGLARAKSGAFIISYRKSQDETQVVSFSRDLMFANRFQANEAQRVRSGEASLINFKRERSMPSLPRAVAVASLKEFSATLELDERTFNSAANAAKNRADRRLAVDLRENAQGVNRAPASSGTKKGSYERHPASAEDSALMEHFADRIVGGSTEGRKLLVRSPAGTTAVTPRGGRGRVEVDARTSETRDSKSELSEKRRLMEELSKVRLE